MGRHLLATAIVVFGLLGCDDQSSLAPDVPLAIYLLSDFRHEPVDVSVDGKQLYAGTVDAVPFSGPAVSTRARSLAGTALKCAWARNTPRRNWSSLHPRM